MAKVNIIKELLVKTVNKVGMMAEVTGAMANRGVNITAFHAFGTGNDAIFRIITSDNTKASDAIKAKNFEASEEEVVSVALENKPGTAAEMGKKLRDANIDIKYIYGSTCDCGSPSTIIFNSSDNKKAVEVLS